MIPLWITFRLRTGNGRSFALHLPLVLLWLFVLPFAVLLAPLGLVWCLRRRVNPLYAAGALWALLGASRGTVIEVEHPGAAVWMRII